MMQRCIWCKECNPVYVAYHDTEWGVPQFDDRYLFEMLRPFPDSLYVHMSFPETFYNNHLKQ